MSVYFIQAGISGPVKIGYTRSAEVRLSALQTANAENLTMLRIITPAQRKVESWAQAAFRRLWLRGEWYKFDEAMLTWTPSPQAGYLGAVKNKHARMAAEIVGGVNVLADILGVSRQAIYSWDDTVPAERVIPIERATGGKITRHEMRADIYPKEARKASGRILPDLTQRGRV